MFEKEQRKINKGVLVGWASIAIALSIAYLIEALKGSKSFPYFFIFISIDLIPLLFTLNLYRRNKACTYIKVICAVSYSALYAFALLTASTVLVFTFVLPMLCVFILCNDAKLIGLFGISSFVLNIIYLVIKALSKEGLNEGLTNYEIQMVAIVFCMTFAYISTRISTDLYKERMRVIQVNEERKADTLNKVIEVEAVVRNTSKDMSSKLEVLANSFSYTLSAMEETVAGSSNTTDAVQKQLSMTEDMQKIFNDTKDLEYGILKTVETTVDTVSTGRENMKILEESAKQVEISSTQVMAQMEELQNTAEKVEEIVGMISAIANKTNLLALNASIEAARAGEAGRGFSVVAGEITDLATQTKQATDNISSMISTLRTKACESRLVADEMAKQNKNQNHYIYETNSDFAQISTAVESIKISTEKQNKQMERLIQAINSIVDSINTISAISEEVVASANQTYENTNNNVEIVTVVNDLAKELTESVIKLEQFVKET